MWLFIIAQKSKQLSSSACTVEYYSVIKMECSSDTSYVGEPREN